MRIISFENCDHAILVPIVLMHEQPLHPGPHTAASAATSSVCCGVAMHIQKPMTPGFTNPAALLFKTRCQATTGLVFH